MLYGENCMGKIRFIAAGGTIDAKEYDLKEGRVITFGDPALEHILKTGRVRTISLKSAPPLKEDADIWVLEERKDSLDMNDEDRNRILLLCLLEERNRIVITHGTDTMKKTGLLLKEHIRGKTIVLTGAMLPYQFKDSDAAINVGMAIAACQIEPPGVYIAMNGKVLPVDRADKIKEPGDAYFKEVEPSFDWRNFFEAQSLRSLIKRLLHAASPDGKDDLIIERVPLEARISPEGAEMPGIKEAFYTAGYRPDSLERYLAPMNHTHIYVLEGTPYKIEGEIFLAAGNPLIDLLPGAFRIIERGVNEQWAVFIGKNLNRREAKTVAKKTGIINEYKKGRWMRRCYDLCQQHNNRELLLAIWNAPKPETIIS